jgi:hypothetical protein
VNFAFKWVIVSRSLALGLFLGILVLFCWSAGQKTTAPVDLRPVTDPDDAGVSHRSVMAALGTNVVSPLTFQTGVSGTVTVAKGYVVGISAVASGSLPEGGVGVDGGSYATVQITPSGPNVADGATVVQPLIPIPGGDSWSLGRPVIQGSANEMGVGTTIVFTGTTAYTVVISLGGS